MRESLIYAMTLFELYAFIPNFLAYTHISAWGSVVGKALHH